MPGFCTMTGTPPVGIGRAGGAVVDPGGGVTVDGVPYAGGAVTTGVTAVVAGGAVTTGAGVAIGAAFTSGIGAGGGTDGGAEVPPLIVHAERDASEPAVRVTASR